MSRKLPIGFCLAASLAFLTWRLRTEPASAQITNQQPAPAAEDLQSVTMIFGHEDAAPSRLGRFHMDLRR